jgi:hypothetical protein
MSLAPRIDRFLTPAVLPEVLDFASELEDLAGEAGLVASEDVEAGVLDRCAHLGNHDFDAVFVWRIGGVVDESEVEDVVLDEGEAVEPGVRVMAYLIFSVLALSVDQWLRMKPPTCRTLPPRGRLRRNSDGVVRLCMRLPAAFFPALSP